MPHQKAEKLTTFPLFSSSNPFKIKKFNKKHTKTSFLSNNQKNIIFQTITQNILFLHTILYKKI